MKNQKLNTLVSLLSTFFMMVTMAGCVEPIAVTPPEVDEDVELTFRIILPDASILTKAEVAAVGKESKIYDLQVWAFTHGGAADETAVGYGQLKNAEGSISTITIKFKKNAEHSPNELVLNGAKLDFYALANGRSVGFPFETDQTYQDYPGFPYLKRSKLQAATFGDGNGAGFGTACVSDVPDGTDYKGLPMACFFDNGGAGFSIEFLQYGLSTTQINDITGCSGTYNGTDFDTQLNNITGLANYQKAYLKTLFKISEDQYKWDADKVRPTLPLERAVSKIRFVFAKAASMTDDEVQISSITLIDGNEKPMLPLLTYLFPREDPSDKSIKPNNVEYADVFSWTGTGGAALVADANIQRINTPLRLRKDCTTVKYDENYAVSETGTTPSEMSSQDYENLLDKSIAATSQKILYLRESDKSDVKCKIGYKIGSGAIKYATIDIAKNLTNPSNPVPYKLTRNSWWTVYAYFISYELGFNVTVADWEGIGSSPNDNSHLQ